MIGKILMGFGMFMLVLVLCMIIMVLVISSTNKPKSSKEEILKSSQQSPKKALIIYQPSLSDISSRMAHQVAKGLQDGGYEVTLNYPGDHLSIDISKYNLIVFGSAVYAGQSSKALTDYMSKVKDYSSSRIVLYSTGSDPNNTIELSNMEKLIDGTSAYKKIKFLTSAKKENDKIAFDFGKELAKE